MNPKAIGEISEGMVLAHLVKSGVPVLVPFGNNQRYDFVADRGPDGFERIQVKTGRIRGGCVTFKTSNVNGLTGKRTCYSDGADVFYVYCPDNEQVYRVPVSECGASTRSLRVEPTRGGPTSTLNWAHEYIA